MPTPHLLNQKWGWGDWHVHLNRPVRKCWWRLPQWVLPDPLVCNTRAPHPPQPSEDPSPILASLGLLQPA